MFQNSDYPTHNDDEGEPTHRLFLQPDKIKLPPNSEPDTCISAHGDGCDVSNQQSWEKVFFKPHTHAYCAYHLLGHSVVVTLGKVRVLFLLTIKTITQNETGLHSFYRGGEYFKANRHVHLCTYPPRRNNTHTHTNAHQLCGTCCCSSSKYVGGEGGWSTIGTDSVCCSR